MSNPRSPSPRASLSLRSPSITSSARTSFDFNAASPLARAQAASTAAGAGGTRRNRAALRDYYNIKAAGAGDADEANAKRDAAAAVHTESALPELDREGFEAGTFVRELLEKEGLEGVLRVEGLLVNEIRGLDGERKALVYDNYSRLILAAETIWKMRSNMDPLTPATSTLTPAVAHIVDTAVSISKDLAEHLPKPEPAASKSPPPPDAKEVQRQTVRWALDSPRRLGELIRASKSEDAQQDWVEVQGLLEQWAGVQGADELKAQCEAIMEKS